jgi:hypothetical protein
MRRFHVLLGVLVAVSPVLLLYAHNASQLHPDQLLRPLLVVAASAGVLQALAALWLRQVTLSAVFAGAIVLGLQLFGHAASLLGRTGVGARIAAALAALLLVLAFGAMTWSVGRVRRRPQAWRSLGNRLLVVVGLLVLVQCGRVLAVEGRLPRLTPRSDVSSPVAGRSDVELPDIYFILLDGYGRSDVLRRMYGFDNRDFLRELERSGFQVADKSDANYVGTLWSLASLLNLDHLQELIECDASLQSMNPLIRLVRSSRVVHLLRRSGYRIVSFASGYGVAEFVPDVYLQAGPALDDFEQLVLQTTPLPWLLPRGGDPHEAHRRRLRWILDTLPAVPASDAPQFVFAHILAPHPPFVFDASGGAPLWPRTFALNDGSDYYRLGGTVQDYRRLYAGQVRWVTEQVETVVRRLLQRKADSPPVIVLLSDHGPGSELDWDSVDRTNVQERFGILCALFLPGATDVVVPRDLSPASVFRLVFDVYLGTRLGPLPPRSWFSSTRRPYDFVDVTSRLQSPLQSPPDSP